MIPSSMKEDASFGFSMMFYMHLFKTACTHVKGLYQKLCHISGSCAVLLVASISEMTDIHCFSSLNHAAPILLLLV